jgi:hypothetical protein
MNKKQNRGNRQGLEILLSGGPEEMKYMSHNPDRGQKLRSGE